MSRSDLVRLADAIRELSDRIRDDTPQLAERRRRLDGLTAAVARLARRSTDRRLARVADDLAAAAVAVDDAIGQLITTADRGQEYADHLAGRAAGTSSTAGAGAVAATTAERGELTEPAPPLPPLDDIAAARGTDEWAAAVVERYPRLTTDEVLAIHHYTTVEGVEEMNGHLRRPAETPDADRKALQKLVDDATAGLLKLPRRPGVTFRGTNLPEHVLATWQPGEVVSDAGFFSTSTDPVTAEDFRGTGNAYIRITGRSGVDVQPLSAYGQEDEILLPRGTNFLVRSRQWDDGRACWAFRLEEVAS